MQRTTIMGHAKLSRPQQADDEGDDGHDEVRAEPSVEKHLGMDVHTSQGKPQDVDCEHAGDGEALCGLAVLQDVDDEEMASGDWQRAIKEVVLKGCIEIYDKGLCEGITDMLFDGVEPENHVTEDVCKELRDLVNMHFCHKKLTGKIGALLQRSQQKSMGDMHGADTALVGKGGSPAPAPERWTPWFRISHGTTSNCLTALAGGNTARLSVETCHFNDASQKWRWWRRGTQECWGPSCGQETWALQVESTKRCLDSPYHHTNGGAIWTYDCSTNNENQWWKTSLERIGPYNQLQYTWPSPWAFWQHWCVDSPGGTSDPHVWSCDINNPNQKWRFLAFARDTQS